MFRTVLLVLLAVFSFPLAAAESDLMYPPGVSIPARPVAQLTTEWWQWAMSFSDDDSPIQDESGVNCGKGQSGEIWFLAGGFGSSKIHRVCSLPEGKTLFFPVINMVSFPNQPGSTRTCELVKVDAAVNNATALELFAELDGVSLGSLKPYRLTSTKCFDIFGRIPAERRPYSAYPSATDEFWLLLKPLKKGRHLLKFGGKYNRYTDPLGRMVQDIEYELVVK